MNPDQRYAAARYYDLQEFHNDIPFYQERLPNDSAHVLELGCGTGRVLVPLAASCRSIHGIEKSPAMLAICRDRMQVAGLSPSRAVVELGDASQFDIQQKFDLIIAPFRVFQALETDQQVEGCLAGIRDHLAEYGSAILSMFNPKYPPDRMCTEWVTNEERLDYEVERNGERIVCVDRRPRLDPDRLVLYPELVYRRYRGEDLIEEVVMPIVMRCWYPNQIIDLLESHGFRVIAKWGGYEGEKWREGSELIVQFENA